MKKYDNIVVERYSTIFFGRRQRMKDIEGSKISIFDITFEST